VPKVKKLKQGDPLDPKTNIGTMVDQKAVAKTKEIFEDAKKGGAKFATGGKINGLMVAPTVLTNVKPDMKACRLEAFSPLVAVQTYKNFEDAVAQVNDSPFGLQAGVFTNRLDDVFYAFKHIDAGGIVVNDVPTFRADQQPYGGMKDSGIGREGVRYAIEDFTEIKILSMNLRG